MMQNIKNEYANIVSKVRIKIKQWQNLYQIVRLLFIPLHFIRVWLRRVWRYQRDNQNP